MCVRVVDEGEEALDHIERVVLLAQGEKGVGTAALLRRCGTSACDTDGKVLAWRWCPDLLNADLVPPGDVEVVLIEEALAAPQTEIGQADLIGIVGKADPAEVGDAVVLAVDDELVEV